MRLSLTAFVLLATSVGLATAAAAQYDAPTPPPAAANTQRSWGLGIALTSNGGADGLPVDIRFPLRLGNQWRLEPEFGGYRSSSTYSTYSNDPNYPTPDVHYDGPKYHGLRLALALTKIIPVDSSVRFYVGGRLGMQRTTAIYDVDGNTGTAHLDITTVDRDIGFLTGVEASFGSRMTLGGEVGITYTRGGKARVSLPAYYYAQISDSGRDLMTTGAIVMRWFPGKS